MALFKISKGTAANLVTNRPYAAEGNAYFTTDDGKFYIDIAGDGTSTTAVVGTNRIPLNAAQADKVTGMLTIQLNNGLSAGQDYFTYDGSNNVLINITPQLIGAAPASAIGAADHWATARNFVISDADGTNIGIATAVDGTSNVTLYLPSTIKASITGNASTATAVSSNLTIQFNNGLNEGSDLFTYNGSIAKTVNITPSSIGALALSGGTMTGSIVMPTGSSAVNTTGSILWEQSGDTTVQASIGSNSLGTMAIAAVKDIRLYPKLADTNIGLQITANSAFGPLTDNTWNLGSSSKKWANVYAYNFIGNASTASQLTNNLVIQFNNGLTEGNNLFTYNGSAGKTINITPSILGAVAKSGDEMTGDLILSSSTGDSPSIIFKRGTELDNLDDIRLYDSGGKLTIAHRSGSADWVDLFTFDISVNTSTQHLIPSTNNTLSLGASDHKWATVYATTFSGNATSADQVNSNLVVQFNNGLTEGSDLFTYNGSTQKTINITPSAIGALSATSGAVSADKWTTARNFYIADSTNSNTGAATSVDGSANVTLKLPATIQANIVGNASTATSVSSNLIIQLNNGMTENSNLFTYNGSVQKNVNITPASISALALAGGTMTGSIILPAQNSGLDDTGAIIWKDNNTIKGHIMTAKAGTLGLYGTGMIVLRADRGNTTKGVTLTTTTFYPDTTNDMSLGTSSHKWSTVYATSFNGLATEAAKVSANLVIQFNSGLTEGSNLFTYNGSTQKTIDITPANINAVAKSGDTMTGFLTLHANPTNAMHAVTKQYADGLIAAGDAMRYLGTINGGATSPGTFTVAANAGDTYRVALAGYVNGQPVEVGDLVICNTDSTAAATSSNYSTIANNWNIIQVNIDHALFYGTNTLTSGAVLLADGGVGKTKTAGTIGSNTQPIYLNGGAPTALSYTANRLYYSASASSFAATGHYASSDKIAINSTSAPTGVLHINGKTTASDNIEITMSGGEPTVSVSNGTHKLGMLIASQGSRHGLWSFTSTAKYLIYRDGSGSVYVPDWASIGGTTQPIYINSNGYPTITQFSLSSTVGAGIANRIAYYVNNNEIDDASTHYISNTQIHLGSTTATTSGYTLEVTGKAKFNNPVELMSGQWFDDSGHYALHLNNSDIIGVNSIWTADDSQNANEGIHFPNGSNWDTLFMAGGGIYFHANHARGAGGAGKRVPTTQDNLGSEGSADRPVYVAGGIIKPTTYYLQATVQSGTKWGVAYYNNDNPQSITSTAQGAANTALMGKGAAAPAFVAVSPTLTPTSGAANGQKIKLTVLGVGGSEITLDSAATDKSGVINTGTQSFAGIKTFTNQTKVTASTESTSTSTGALIVTGGVGVGMTMSAFKVRVGDKVRLEYNSTTLSLDFIFE